jgi:hypothetical protein
MSDKNEREFDFIGRVFKSQGIKCAICGKDGPSWGRNHSDCEEKARKDIVYALLDMLEISEKDRLRERQEFLDNINKLSRCWQEQAKLHPDGSVTSTMYLARSRDIVERFYGFQSRIDGARILSRECVKDFKRRILKEIDDPRFLPEPEEGAE